MEQNSSLTQDILFYDGKCPLCRKEIAFISRHNSGGLLLVDIHSLSPMTDNSQPSQIELLRTLHLQRGDGTWLLGADATVQAWAHTRFGFLLKPLRWPFIKHLVDRIYQIWADRRFRKRYLCGECRLSN